MKKIYFLVVAVIVMATSCTTTMPVAVSKATVGDKSGSSSSWVIGMYYLNSKYGVKQAAENGGIKGAIAIIDETTFALPFICKKTLKVYAAK